MRAHHAEAGLHARRLARFAIAWSLADMALGTASGAQSLRIANELADDQRFERVTVFLDGAKAGEIAVDAKRKQASLRPAVSRPRHRYRLAGEGEIDGVVYRIAGARLIVDQKRMDEIAAIALTPGGKFDGTAVVAAEKRLGTDREAKTLWLRFTELD